MAVRNIFFSLGSAGGIGYAALAPVLPAQGAIRHPAASGRLKHNIVIVIDCRSPGFYPDVCTSAAGIHMRR